MTMQEAGMDGAGRREASQPECNWLEHAIRIRDKRLALLGWDICLDPAWDIILFLARSENAMGATFQQIATEVTCSPETLCRWLRILIDRKHVERFSAEGFKLSETSQKGLPDIFA